MLDGDRLDFVDSEAFLGITINSKLQMGTPLKNLQIKFGIIHSLENKAGNG